MAKKAYVGDDSVVARRIPKGYIGIDGVARRILKGYVGDDDGVARQIFGNRTLTFAYSLSSSDTAYVSITLPDGRVIDYSNQLELVEVSEGDTLRIFTQYKSTSSSGEVIINGVTLRDNDDDQYYDYTVTKNATLKLEDTVSGVNVVDPETGEITSSSKGYNRGKVTITELDD